MNTITRECFGVRFGDGDSLMVEGRVDTGSMRFLPNSTEYIEDLIEDGSIPLSVFDHIEYALTADEE